MTKPFLYRLTLNAVISLGLLCVLLIVIAYFFAKTLPDLSYWHFDETVKNYDLKLDVQNIDSFEQYLAEEEALFVRLKLLIANNADPALVGWNRYQPESLLNSQLHSVNWNRSFILRPASPRAVAVLVHGLSDSPYSLRALAKKFYAEDILVLGLRVPGHGTIPAALRETTWRDFRRAVLLAGQWVTDEVDQQLPFYMVGYSNGAALITDYTLSAMNNKTLRSPEALVMLSPAMIVSPIAVFASAQRLISELPSMDKLAWIDVMPEYDPYKYNSFPVAAGEQIYKLTSSLQARLQTQQSAGALKDFPPVLAFQSMVDATIPADAPIAGLLDYLEAADNQLVLFNVNRSAKIAPMLRTGHEQWLENLKARTTTPFAIKVIRNRSDDSLWVDEMTRPPYTEQWHKKELSFEWPPTVYSLSHVALPFAANDPWYGAGGREQGGDVLHLGAMEKRGERGVFGVSMDQLSRLRYNPFYSYLEESVMDFIDRPEAATK